MKYLSIIITLVVITLIYSFSPKRKIELTKEKLAFQPQTTNHIYDVTEDKTNRCFKFKLQSGLFYKIYFTYLSEHGTNAYYQILHLSTDPELTINSDDVSGKSASPPHARAVIFPIQGQSTPFPNITFEGASEDNGTVNSKFDLGLYTTDPELTLKVVGRLSPTPWASGHNIPAGRIDNENTSGFVLAPGPNVDHCDFSFQFPDYNLSCSVRVEVFVPPHKK